LLSFSQPVFLQATLKTASTMSSVSGDEDSSADTSGGDDLGRRSSAGDESGRTTIGITELSALIEERLAHERQTLQASFAAALAALQEQWEQKQQQERSMWQAQTTRLGEMLQSLQSTVASLTAPPTGASLSKPPAAPAPVLRPAVPSPASATPAPVTPAPLAQALVVSSPTPVSASASGDDAGGPVPVVFEHARVAAALEALERDAAQRKSHPRNSLLGVDDETGDTLLQALSLNLLLDYVLRMPPSIAMKQQHFLDIVCVTHPHFADAVTFAGVVIARWNASARSGAPVHDGLARRVTKMLLENQRREYVALLRFWLASSAETVLLSADASELVAAFGSFLGEHGLTGADGALVLPKMTPALSPFASAGSGAVQFASVLELNADDVARQLALQEHALFVAVRRSELVKQAWTKAARETTAANVCALTRWFNHVAGWVLLEILQVATAAGRAKVLEQFIRIADASVRLRNYSAAMEIASSLHSSAVARLTQSWALVPPKYVKVFERLSKLISPDKNWAELRRSMSGMRTPCVPYIGVFLTDLTFLDESAPDVLDGGLINFDKLERIYDRLADVVHMQQGAFDFVPQTMLMAYIQQAKPWDEHEVYRVSKLREGRAVAGAAPTPDGAAPPPADAPQVRFNKRLGDVARAPVRVGSRATLSEREWQVIGAGCAVRELPIDKVIVAPESNNRFLFRVRAGAVRVRERCIDGTFFERVVEVGQLFGEPSVVLRTRDSFTSATALSACVIESVSASFLLQLFEHRPSIGAIFYRIVANATAARIVDVKPGAVVSTGDGAPSAGGGGGGGDNDDLGDDPEYEYNEDDSIGDSPPLVSPFKAPTSASSSSSSVNSSMNSDEAAPVDVPGEDSAPVAALTSSNKAMAILGLTESTKTPGRLRTLSREGSFQARARSNTLGARTDSMSFGLKRPSHDEGLTSAESERKPAAVSASSDEVMVAEFPATLQFHSKLTLHGTLFVSQVRIVFEPSFFSAKNRKVALLDDIVRIARGKAGCIRMEMAERALEFGGFTDVDVAFDIISGIHRHHSRHAPVSRLSLSQNQSISLNAFGRAGSGSTPASAAPTSGPIEDILSGAEWELLTQGAKTVVLAKAGDSVEFGAQSVAHGARVYQVVRGSATERVRRVNADGKPGDVVVTADLTAPECCGLFSFLLGDAVRTEIVATADDTVLNVIENYFLDICFGMRNGIECHFFRYVAALMQRRLRLLPSAVVQRAQADAQAAKAQDEQLTILALQKRAMQAPRPAAAATAAAPGAAAKPGLKGLSPAATISSLGFGGGAGSTIAIGGAASTLAQSTSSMIAQVHVPEHGLYKYIDFPSQAVPNDVVTRIRSLVPAIANASALSLLERINDKDHPIEMTKPLCTLRSAANGKMPVLVVRVTKAGLSTSGTTTAAPAAAVAPASTAAAAAAAPAVAATAAPKHAPPSPVKASAPKEDSIDPAASPFARSPAIDALDDEIGALKKERSALEIKMSDIEKQWRNKAKNRAVLDQLTSIGLSVAELTDRISTLQKQIAEINERMLETPSERLLLSEASGRRKKKRSVQPPSSSAPRPPLPTNPSSLRPVTESDEE
jgi:hypothetical protein